MSTRIIRNAIMVAVATLWAASAAQAGSLFVMTDGLGSNEVVMYDRADDGALSFVGAFATGGEGVGDTTEPVDALGSQGSLVLSDDGRWLLAANAGSDEISVFQVYPQGLRLADKVGSGGSFPASIAISDGLVYVLNSGGDGNITGFRLGYDGTLRALPGSTRSLDAGGTNPPFFLVSPAQVGFTPDGTKLVVTQKGTDEIHVFPLDHYGRPSAAPVTTESVGSTPFGFTFSRHGYLVVAEPFGSGEVGEAGASAVSSYAVADDGALIPLARSVDNGQTATCWAATGGQRRFVYTTNNASDTVTGYRVRYSGRLDLLDADGIAGHTGHAPVDLALSPDGRFLYTLNAGDGTISMFAVNPFTGALSPLGDIGGLPAEDGIVGMAVL
ncbi:lactonase family protein [Haliangium sp.]|uniref:lactonase family protein n=1 Tax=Haliangium sp. TaxID=2663208 RepID=UPI003D0B1C9C